MDVTFVCFGVYENKTMNKRNNIALGATYGQRAVQLLSVTLVFVIFFLLEMRFFELKLIGKASKNLKSDRQCFFIFFRFSDTRPEYYKPVTPLDPAKKINWTPAGTSEKELPREGKTAVCTAEINTIEQDFVFKETVLHTIQRRNAQGCLSHDSNTILFKDDAFCLVIVFIIPEILHNGM